MPQYVLDGHKLHHHPERVANWMQGKDVLPIYVEISPVAHCNHRCLFCNYNYLGHAGFFPKGGMLALADQLAQSGVKAVVFAGAGEPTLHPETFPAIEKLRTLGLDVAMSTNGALLQDEHFTCIARDFTWIRFSVSGGNPESYSAVHRTKPEDYETVLGNIRKLREVKERLGSSLTIGTQYVLLPQNKDFVVSQGKIMKEIGADYFVVKHFYNHDKNAFKIDPVCFTPDFFAQLSLQAKALSDERFRFIVRDPAVLDRNRPYDRCEGLPFLLYVSEKGDVFSCFSHQEDPQTCFGNVLITPFAQICRSESKQHAIRYIQDRIDKNTCQDNCRHHQLNLYLWGLAHPPPHVNFI